MHLMYTKTSDILYTLKACDMLSNMPEIALRSLTFFVYKVLFYKSRKVCYNTIKGKAARAMAANK